jgi:hypothetical protein
MAGFYLTVAGKSSAMMAATAGNIAFHPNGSPSAVSLIPAIRHFLLGQPAFQG